MLLARSQRTNTNDNKLIIDGAGTISNADWEMYEERIFRTTMTSSYEKLVLGGSGFLAALLKHYEDKVTVTRTSLMDEHKLQFTFMTVETRYGIDRNMPGSL